MATGVTTSPPITTLGGGVGETLGQLALSRLLILGLAPGVLAVTVYVLLSGPMESARLPPAFGLMLAIALVIIPFELGVVVRAGRLEAPGRGALAAIPYRVPMSARGWAVLYPGLLLAGLVGFALVGAIEPAIRDSLFGWLPGWFLDPLPVDSVASYPTGAWVLTLATYIVLNVVAGPLVEELYFRGSLLPRMSRYGRWAPLLNALLFSLYHFWSPWQFMSRVAGGRSIRLRCVVEAQRVPRHGRARITQRPRDRDHHRPRAPAVGLTPPGRHTDPGGVLAPTM